MSEIAKDPGCRVVIDTFGEHVMETCDKPIVARIEYMGQNGVGLCKEHKAKYYSWKKANNEPL